ncbi:MAG: MBL fold metallo-hydrolase [Actinomycetota bacterium]|nr:MBL fold metallo-hydrolase [Actinomycetota bacterium]
MANLVDTMHLGHDRVIGAWEVRPGVIADPGPGSTVETLLEGVEAEPRVLLLTHIHLDHAGASGVLARRFPDLQVFVHEVGAPHVIDPSRLLKSAKRLYGDEMEKLWGEVAPVPEQQVTILRGGEEVEGLDVHYAPGHARHHVVYHDPESGDAFTGDVAGVRVPPSDLAAAPTPPPEVEVEVWIESIQMLRSLEPTRLCMTHFGENDDVEGQLARVEAWLKDAAEESSHDDPDRFAEWLHARFDAEGGEVAVRLRQAMPPDQLWLGLERYWRKRREREGETAA